MPVTKAPYDARKAAAALARADPALARVIERVGECQLHVRRPLSPFQELLHAIVNQQLSGKAAEKIFARVCALFPAKRWPSASDILSVAPEALREAGMSHAKIAAVKDLAERSRRRSLPGLNRLQCMSDAEIIERLTEVRGVGRWTVEMLLLFKLGRPDVLPATDLGVRKGVMAIYQLDELPAPAQVLEYAQRWRPNRSVATWYLWRAAATVKEEASYPTVAGRTKPVRPVR